MKSKLWDSRKKLKNVILAITAIISIFLVHQSFSDNKPKIILSEFAESNLTVTPLANPIPFSSTVPTDVANGYDASSEELAIFAWQEFIALNWPAKKNPSPVPGMSDYYRGQASTSKLGSTGSGGVVVWETFQHRVELFPGGQPYSSDITLSDINIIPTYKYNATVTNAIGVDTTLFNNLDEASEITLAEMYFTPFAEQVQALREKYGINPTTAQINEIEEAGIKAGIVYEAKANPVVYNYIKTNKFNNAAIRKAALSNSIDVINNKEPRNPGSPIFSLPSGSIENKATWRRYDESMDDLKDYHWTTGIYYKGEMVQNGTDYETANDIFLLVGLHIIQKTPNIPTFTFATFEHISNEKYGFRFKNTKPRTDSLYTPPLPDDGVRKAIRQYPIPDALKNLNTSVQQQLRTEFGNDIVWANYRLIGVQAKVQDNPLSRGGEVPDQEFFLSNFATETNNTLQFFQGTRSGINANVPDPNVAKVYVQNTETKVYKAFKAGGCLGCHGAQGQSAGGDFSVISATGNFFAPEPTEPYPIGMVSDQDKGPFPLPQKQR